MLITSNRKTNGFSLVEMMVGLFVMALVITGGMVALTQANLLSEKANDQATADFLLRVETERLRSMSWTEVEALATTIEAYESAGSGKLYNIFQSITPADLTDIDMTAEVKTDDVLPTGSRGKKIFHLTLEWKDQTNRDHSETRIIILTEGGLSAK